MGSYSGLMIRMLFLIIALIGLVMLVLIVCSNMGSFSYAYF
jgi:hypothetical protein